MTEQEVRMSDPPKPEQRTIYSASGWEIFGRNFLAGMAQALGHILIYLLFVAGVFAVAFRFLWPVVQPYVDIYKQSLESLQMIQSFTPGYVPPEEAGTEQNMEDVPSYEGTSQPSQPTMGLNPDQLRQAQELLQQMQQGGN